MFAQTWILGKSGWGDAIVARPVRPPIICDEDTALPRPADADNVGHGGIGKVPASGRVPVRSIVHWPADDVLSTDSGDDLTLFELCNRYSWPLVAFVGRFVLVADAEFIGRVGKVIAAKSDTLTQEIFHTGEMIQTDASAVCEVGDPSSTRQFDGMLAELQAECEQQ